MGPDDQWAIAIGLAVVGIVCMGVSQWLLSDTMTDLPTARTILRHDSWLCLLVWCRACFRQAPADPRAIIASGRGDVRRAVIEALLHRVFISPLASSPGPTG